ncbi:MAG: glutamine-hydrolyzing GMP synthase [Clostridiales bacterium]|nr:glutamine-hydrolyzing GMP synthase [Clostridiales bacterium]
MQQKVIVLDFGGQYNQLIARRVREANVYSEIFAYTASIERIKEYNPSGIILTGGPKSVYEENAPKIDKKLFELGIPILGICYGNHIMAKALGGIVESAELSEYGHRKVALNTDCLLFKGLDSENICWMSHTDQLGRVPERFKIAAHTETCPIAAMYNEDKKLYSVQFHPEVMHTQNGQKMLENFLYEVCGCSKSWTMENVAYQKIEEIKQQVGDKKVLLGLSGGVDSSVAAVLLSKAIGKNLTCIFVDHGLLRKDEGDEVEAMFAEGFDLNFVRVNAQDRFLSRLVGIIDPEEKRKIIGEEFIRVFEEEARKVGHVDFLAQGTIYPDVVESGEGHADVIKSHHNVGGLPDVVDFDDIIEPLRELFKDEVRAVGLEIGLDESLVWRQPFPGPGLAIRIIGDITKEKLDTLREADYIFRNEISEAGLDRDIWQYFAALTNIRTVGVMGDARTYDYVLALRAVTSVDAMTADWSRIPYDVLAKISNTIINEVAGINRVVYDITSKPPGTIEWE